MQRDIGGEILVAIGTLTVLAFGLVFGVVVSLSNRQVDTTPPATRVVGETTPTATLFVLLPDATITVAVDSSVTPTSTPTLTPTVTETSVEVVETETTLSTVTTTGTATFTRTPTLTLTSTVTPSATRTPTVTRTLSPVPSKTVALSPTPTPAVTLTRTDKPTRTPTNAVTPSSVPCGQPPGWEIYIVQSGNTLFSIAQAVGSTVAELRRVNCLASADFIVTGDVLFVPLLPAEPVLTNVPQATEGASMTKLGCSPSTANITNLYAGQTVSGNITLIGTASIAEHWYFKVEVRRDDESQYDVYSTAPRQVVNGELMQVNTSTYGVGLHWVRLVVVALDGSVPENGICVVPLVFGG